jgi:hypothetical protein
MVDESKAQSSSVSGSETISVPKWALWMAAGVVIVAVLLALSACAVYDLGRDNGFSAGVASVPTPAPTPVPTPATVPVPAPVVVQPVVIQPTLTTITNVQSIGTQWGYVCIVDNTGTEYLITNFDPGTAELLGASYSGTTISSYNGIPMVENVALTAYPVDSTTYYNGAWYMTDHHGHYYTSNDGHGWRTTNRIPVGDNIPGEAAKYWVS